METVISLTLTQLNDMKHTIGYNELSKLKKGVYTAYRNYFCTNDKELSWENLCEQGLAKARFTTNSVIYYLSDKGLRLLEEIYCIKIKEME